MYVQFLYLIFQVDGPGNFSTKQKEGTTVGWDYRTRLILERWIEVSFFPTTCLYTFTYVSLIQTYTYPICSCQGC